MQTIPTSEEEENTTGGLTNDELYILNKMLCKLINVYRPKNAVHEEFYEGHNKMRDLGLSLPDELKNLSITPSWANIAVEMLNDRLNLEGFVGDGDSEDAQEIFESNDLGFVSNLAHRDALIYGVTYLLAGLGDKNVGEPEVVITSESPNFSIGEFDSRSGNCEAFLKVMDSPEHSYIEFMLPYATYLLKMTRIDSVGMVGPLFQNIWLGIDVLIPIQNIYNVSVIKVDDHNLGFVPATKIVNKPRATNDGGKSEITRNLRQFINDAQNTLASIVSMREIFSSPRIVITNAGDLTDEDGFPTEIGSTYMDEAMILGGGANGNAPVVSQLKEGTVSGYLAILKEHASNVSAMTSIPISMLGYTNSTPTSAESIEASLYPLAKKAEDRTKSFSVSWMRIIRLALLLLGKPAPAGIRPKWRNTHITSSGNIVRADGTAKLVAAGILQPNSSIVYEMLGLDEARIQQAQKEYNLAMLFNSAATATAIRATGFEV